MASSSRKVRVMTDENIEAVLKIFEDNQNYSFVKTSLGLAGHISNILFNLYNIDLPNYIVRGLICKINKRYNDLSRAWSRGHMLQRTWPYYDRVNKIITGQVRMSMVESVEPQQESEMDKDRFLTPEDTWTVGELESLVLIYEGTNAFRFARPHLGLCEKISRILRKKYGIEKTGHQVQVKVKRLNKKVNRFAKPKESYKTYPFFQRIKRLHNRM